MGCSKCNSEEISSSGICLVCGYGSEANATARSPEPARKESDQPGAIELTYCDARPQPSQEDQLPEWRQELSKRLQAIREKREKTGQPSPSVSDSQSKAARDLLAKAEKRTRAQRIERETHLSCKRSARVTSIVPRTPEPRQPELFAVKPASKAIDRPGEVKDLIDNVVSKRSAHAATSIRSEIPPSLRATAGYQEGRLILLSRTLSGLVDLIVVVVCTGAFIIAADFFAGIYVLDSISLAIYSVLFLMTYFLYSLFFLGASNQTLGMMITELRVVESKGKRPSIRQLLLRCFGYLLSLTVFGIGLLSGVFDRESRCIHDRLSGTLVVRI